MHLNLGKDDISEKDVLKKIVQNVCLRYNSETGFFSNFTRFLWICILYLLIILCLFPYYQENNYGKITDLRSNVTFVEYLPTQIWLGDFGDNLDYVDSLLQNNFGPQLMAKIDSMKNRNPVIFKSLMEELRFRSVMTSDSSMIQSLSLVHNFEINNQKNQPMIKMVIQYLDYFLYNTYEKFIGFIYQEILPCDWDVAGFRIGNPNDYMRINKYITEEIIVLSNDFMLLPKQIDYIGSLYILLILLVFHIIGRYRLLGFNTHSYVKRKLKLLKDRIDSETSFHHGSGFNFKPFSLKNISNKKYPIADYDVMEVELISLFRVISQIPTFLSRPRFIFVFDELDKIEPFEKVKTKEKEVDSESIKSNLNGKEYASVESHRNRQQVVSRLLASLKHFFNTVDAKFLFIAGREMHDASLADTSDRESFTGSIFNKVIYVNSFYSDNSDQKPSDLTSMTESFVCQYLLPISHCKEEYKSLKEYYRYLKSNINLIRIRERGEYKEDLMPRVHKFNIEELKGKGYTNDQITDYIDIYNKLFVKVYYTLQNFITYLAYRSNGFPKKMSQLFENYIVDSDDTQFKKDGLIIGDRNKNSFYLRFTPDDHYRFSFTSQLFTPLILGKSKYTKELNDKLLVSTSFLVDHMFKYHKSAFSWQNLQLTPEIIDINKAPQLREFIANIVDHLSKSHLRGIISGLFQFKFQSKIRFEIDFISKISELESAAFNFTLDESLRTKKYYQKKLNNEREVMMGYTYSQQNAYVHSIGYYNSMLGDLYFYDQEYDEALKYYKNANQEMRLMVEKSFNTRGDTEHVRLEKNIFNLSIYIRNFMKIGLTYEKQNNHDDAILTYGNISNEIIRYRDFDLFVKFRLYKIQLTKGEIDDFVEKYDLKLITVASGFISNKMQRGFVKDIIKLSKQRKELEVQDLLQKVDDYFSQSLAYSAADKRKVSSVLNKKMTKERKIIISLLTIYLSDKPSVNIVVNEDDSGDFFSFEENLMEVLRGKYNGYADLHSYEFARSYFENIRLGYQPLIAKLSLMEKGGLNGITYTDLWDTEREVSFILKPINNHERTLILSEYLNKVGDILFYKNGLVLGTYFKQKNNGKTVRKKLEQEELENKFLISPNNKESRYFKAPFSAYYYYFRSLYSIAYGYFGYASGNKEIRKNRLVGNEVSMLELRSHIDNIIIQKGGNYNEEKALLKHIFGIIINGIGSYKNYTSKAEIIKSAANSLSDIGDSLFAMATSSNKISFGLIAELDFWSESKNITELTEKDPTNSSLDTEHDDLEKVEKIINRIYPAGKKTSMNLS